MILTIALTVDPIITPGVRGCATTSTGMSQLGGPSSAFDQLRKDLLHSGQLYTDSTFPADESSLYYSQRPPCQIVWMRPSEIVAATSGPGGNAQASITPRKIVMPEFIGEGGVKLGELRQGELGKLLHGEQTLIVIVYCYCRACVRICLHFAKADCSMLSCVINVVH